METRCRSLTKVLIWRIIAFITTIIILYISTNDLGKSFTIAGIDHILKIILQYFYERVWNKIKWGIKDDKKNIYLSNIRVLSI